MSRKAPVPLCPDDQRHKGQHDCARPVIEPLVAVCRPLIPIGDLSRLGSAPGHPRSPGFSEAPFHFLVDTAGALRWCLNAPDWCVTSPALSRGVENRVASFEAVLDVYVGLLAAFADAGLPADNAVRFTPAAMIGSLGWTAGSTRRATGSHYRQLELALDYLRLASIESRAVLERLEVIHGTRVSRANFSVLQSWTKTGAPGGVGNADTVEARFSDHFAAMLRHQGGVVRYCASVYNQLPRGVSRAVFRYLSGLRVMTDAATATLPGATLLAHLGSRRRRIAPSRMREILDEPHNVLFAHKLLGDLPVWSETESGEPQLTYVFEHAPDLAPLLEQMARAYGVTAASAHDWAATKADTLTRVLAAAVQGIITPTGNVARMVRHYVVGEHHIDPAAMPHFESGRGLVLPRPRAMEFEYLEEQYRDTTSWLRERPAVDMALRRQYGAAERPKWVCDGLVLLAAQRMRSGPDVRTWRKREGLAPQ